MFMQDFTRTAAAATITPVALLKAPATSGFTAGTLVETASGWRAVETLAIGMRVQTLDGGLCRVLGLDRRTLRPEADTALIRLEGGSYDACSDLVLMPGQHLLIDTLADAEYPDEMAVLIPAAALIGRTGACRHFPARATEIITPMFAEEEVVWANSGVLLHCPAIGTGAGRRPASEFFTRLETPAARSLLARRDLRLRRVA